MIAQYAAAALVNECQVLVHPAGAGSIPTCAGQEDFNSMGALAALKARTAMENAAHVSRPSWCAPARGSSSTARCAPPPALEAAFARVRESSRAWRRTARWPAELAGLAAALRTGELVRVRCRGWLQEAALRMLRTTSTPRSPSSRST